VTKLVLFSAVCLPLLAQRPPLPPDPTPKEVRDLIRNAAEALSNKDVSGFLGHFDGKMLEYATLNYYAEGLAAQKGVISTIEIVSDNVVEKSDDRERVLELDWELLIDSERSRRQIVKVTVERQGKKWKFTALEPVDFFKPPA
jgi:hypothetical protein